VPNRLAAALAGARDIDAAALGSAAAGLCIHLHNYRVCGSERSQCLVATLPPELSMLAGDKCFDVRKPAASAQRQADSAGVAGACLMAMQGTGWWCMSRLRRQKVLARVHASVGLPRPLQRSILRLA
tara:strand:- start:13506 stop:13886 length:381 start_codon:yes stop_codon:yes gene_type:complete